MRWLCAGLLGLCACDALFGLQHVDVTPADAAIDAAPPVEITGTLAREYIHQDASGAPVAELVAYAATEMPLTAHHADGTPIPVAWDPATGRFSFFAATGERYGVTVTGCGVAPFREYQLTSPALALVEHCLGRPDQVPPGPATALEFDAGSFPAADTPIIASTGVWTTSSPTGTPGMYVVSWPSAGFAQGQRPARLSAAGHDTAYLLDYADSGTTPAFRMLTALAQASVTLGDTTTTIATQLTQLSRSYCIDAYYKHTTELNRLRARVPQFTTDSAATAVYSVPLPAHGILTFLGVAASGAVGDDHIAMTYALPFPGQDAELFSAAIVSRDTHGASISAVAGTWDAITPTSSCARHDDPPPMQLAYAPKLAGIALADDVVVGVAPDRPIELTWSIEAAQATPTSATVRIARAKDLVVIAEYLTTASSITIDPTILDAGTFYTAQISLTNGVVNAASGDFTLTSPSFSFSAYQTGYFTVSK